jgi:hypothetical protein
MKYIFFLLLLIPSLARADFATGLIVGSLLSSGPRTTKVEVKDEFAKQVEQIEDQLPSKYSSTANQPTYTFSVIPQDSAKYLNYFKNGGYNVTYKGGQLTFDYSGKYQTYLQYEQERAQDQAAFDQKWQKAKPYLKGLGIGALVIWFLVALVSALQQMHQSGILGYFLDIEKKLLSKVTKDLETFRKKD